MLDKLRDVEFMLAEARDASKTAVDRIKTLSEKVNEISKQQNQLLAEINGNTKMVPGTVVAIKTLAQTVLDTVTRMETAFKELQLPCVETSTLVHDVLEICKRNRDDYYVDLQRAVVEARRKLDVLEQQGRMLDAKIPERPPFRVPPPTSTNASTSSTPATFTIAEHLPTVQPVSTVTLPADQHTMPASVTPEMLMAQAIQLMQQQQQRR